MRAKLRNVVLMLLEWVCGCPARGGVEPGPDDRRRRGRPDVPSVVARSALLLILAVAALWALRTFFQNL